MQTNHGQTNHGHTNHGQILNHLTSQQYTQYINQASQLIKQWLNQQNLYQGGAASKVNNAITLNICKKGMGLEALFDKIESQFLANSISTAHTACLAHLHPPSLVVGQLAELFIAATNQSMDSWNQSPIATSMETQLIDWLCAQCKFINGFGTFTSGGTQSNLMGLLLARNHFYQRSGVDVQEDGLPFGQTGKILCSDQAHFSVEKNAALLGLGRRQVIKINTDAHGAMCINDLSKQMATIGHHNIMAVVATAGTTDSGAIDNLPNIAALCQQPLPTKIWLHVDAAWGGALLLSHKYRQLINGLSLADSLTLDFHKHWFLPISCGAFLLKNKLQYNSIYQHSDYLNSIDDEQDDIANLVKFSLQTTRRFDALKLWMSLEALGTDTYGQLIDTCIDSARQIADYLNQLDDFIVLNTPAINGISSVLFYYYPANGLPKDKHLADAQANKTQLKQLNRHIAQQLLLLNIANIATSQFKNQFCLKFTVLNPNTQLNDIQNIVKHIRLIAQQYD